MGYTFAEKALARAAGLETTVAGQIVDARPDIVLSHDNTAAIARLFQDLGIARIRHPERLAVVLDHAVPAPNAEHARNHAEVRRFVAEQGIGHFFDAGRGICHQVVSEEALILPGQTILGADSHTTHHGWLGAFGAGIGRSEVAALWATGELWLRVPETIRVELTGDPSAALRPFGEAQDRLRSGQGSGQGLPPGVTAKDLSLYILGQLGPEAGIYQALEFGGPGLHTLSIESRMVIPNMMAEAGVKSAYLEPDGLVFEWLAERLGRRGKSRVLGGTEGNRNTVAGWRQRLAEGALYPDPDARYIARYTVNLNELEPMVARPHKPDNSVPLSQIAGTHVDQAFIGTCTNGRLEDLAAAATVLRGPDGQVRHVAAGARLVVIPASSQVLQDALAAGYVETFLAAGAMIGVPGCGPCMGNHLGVPAADEVVISSANRNFRGRMGNPESDIYLASPAVVAASAVLGRIADPREIMGERQESGVRSQESGVRGQGSGDRRQEAEVGGQEVRRIAGQPINQLAKQAIGESITQYPIPNTQYPIPNRQSPIANTQFQGRAWVYGDDVNTDVIFPGKYTYTVREEAEMARHALEDLDPSFAAQVRPGDIVVGGRNFGCGSSREQAVTCLRAAGVRALIAASFARIFYRNAIDNGVLPITCPEAAAAIRPGETISVDLDRCVVQCAAGEFPFQPLSPSVQQIFEAGGLLEMLRVIPNTKYPLPKASSTEVICEQSV